MSAAGDANSPHARASCDCLFVTPGGARLSPVLSANRAPCPDMSGLCKTPYRGNGAGISALTDRFPQKIPALNFQRGTGPPGQISKYHKIQFAVYSFRSSPFAAASRFHPGSGDRVFAWVYRGESWLDYVT